MAKIWFKPYPDLNYMKNLKKYEEMSLFFFFGNLIFKGLFVLE